MNTKTAQKPTCELCGEEAHHIHHIDENHKNNDPDNLQHLCTMCHAEVHGIEPRQSELLKHLRYFEKAQSMRIMINNVVTSYKRIELEIPENVQDVLKDLEEQEKDRKKDIVNFFKENPDPNHEWMTSIKGISDILAAKILAHIDWDKTDSPAALLSYAGMTPGQKKQRGKTANWNHALKRYCYQLSDSFIKQRTPKYREVYDRKKEDYAKRDWKKYHVDLAARRRMVKVFFRDLFSQAG